MQESFSSAGRSLHEAVRQNLLARITGGEFKFGDLLPTEEVLCEQYRVSRITVRRAITDLAAQFIVTRRRGFGTVVRYTGSGRRVFRMTGFFEDRSFFEQLPLANDVVPAENDVAKALKIDIGVKVRRERLVTYREKERFTLADRFVRIEEGPSALGARVERGAQEISAMVADSWTAKHLKIAKGTPLLSARRTYYDDRGEPVRFLFARYHPEHYRFVVDLQSNHGQPVFEGELS